MGMKSRAGRDKKQVIIKAFDVVSIPKPLIDELVGLLEVAVDELQVAAAAHRDRAAIETSGGILEQKRWQEIKHAEEAASASGKLAYWLKNFKDAGYGQ